MNANDIAAIITSIFTALNTVGVTYVIFIKGKKEARKIETEGESEIVGAANVNLQGAALVSTLLKERIDELQNDLEAEKQARREDNEYFRRRIKDIEVELHDYRDYAGRLARQVIKAGEIPEPFISRSSESDPLVQALDKERNKIEEIKTKREEEVKNAKSNS